MHAVKEFPAFSPADSMLLRRIESGLDPARLPAALREVAEKARSRVALDLAPRLENFGAFLTIAIVGPNNSGKSSLFNALCESDLSAVSAVGGFTAQPVAAVNPASVDAVKAVLQRRFALELIDGDTHGATGNAVAHGADSVCVAREADRAAVADEAASGAIVHGDGSSKDQAVLRLGLSAALPPDTVLVDVPDFDSIYESNRLAGQAAILTADLLVVLVTPHTYQNRAVVEFLVSAVEFGRCYCLVYNQARDAGTAASHLAKLEGDLGGRSEACFFARHDHALQAGSSILAPLRLDDGEDAAASRSEGGGDLRSWLFFGPGAARDPAAALAASRRALCDELQALAESWRDSAAVAENLRDGIRYLLLPHCEAAARALFPLQPFRLALQQELDARSGFHQSLRYLPSRLGRLLRSGYEMARSQWGGESSATSSAAQYRAEEISRLLGNAGSGGLGQEHHAGEVLGALWEGLHHQLASVPGVVSADALAEDFLPERRGRLAVEVAARHSTTPLPFDDFRRDCATSIAAELDRRGLEGGLQWAYTALKVLPPAAAVAVMALTGAVGDISALASYLLAEPLLDKSLGRDFVRNIHEQWWRSRSSTLLRLLEQSLAPRSSAELDRSLSAYREGSIALRGWIAEMSDG